MAKKDKVVCASPACPGKGVEMLVASGTAVCPICKAPFSVPTGGPTPSPAPTPSATPAPANNPISRWEIEVSHGGEDGHYSIAVQVTKDGEGIKSKVAIVGIMANDQIFDESGNSIPLATGGSNALIFPGDTDEDGRYCFSVIIGGRQRRMVFRAPGSQADTEIVLYGPKYQQPRAGGFMAAFRKRIGFNRS